MRIVYKLAPLRRRWFQSPAAGTDSLSIPVKSSNQVRSVAAKTTTTTISALTIQKSTNSISGIVVLHPQRTPASQDGRVYIATTTTTAQKFRGGIETVTSHRPRNTTNEAEGSQKEASSSNQQRKKTPTVTNESLSWEGSQERQKKAKTKKEVEEDARDEVVL
jgi:hypothetical protein